MTVPKLTKAQWRAVESVLSWLEASGDENEWVDGAHPSTVLAMRKAHDKIRAALKGGA